MPGIDRRPSGPGGGGIPSGVAGGDLAGTYPDPTLNAPTAAVRLGLGKYVAVGYNGLPTWIDPAAADWADVVANNYAAIQFNESGDTTSVTLLRGNGKVVTQFDAVDTGISRGADWQLHPYSDSSGGPSFSGSLSVVNSGATWTALFDLSSGIGYGEIRGSTETTKTQFFVAGEAAQTDPALIVYNSNFDEILGVAPDGSVGGGVTTTAAAMIFNGSKWVSSTTAVVPAFATPAILFSTTAGAGVASTVIRSDASIVAFDATSPTTQAIGDNAAVGTANVAARRDHKHAMPAFTTNTVTFSTTAAAGSAATLIRSDATIAVFDTTVPTSQTVGDAAVIGTVNFAAHRDHKHAWPTGAQFMAALTSTAAADFSMNSNKITGVNNPTLAQDVATKTYVDTGVGGVPWTIVTKTADQSVVSSTTLVNDNHLLFTTTANASYEIEGLLVYNSPGGAGTPDMKLAAGEDATARGIMSIIAMSTTDTSQTPNFLSNQTATQAVGTSATKRIISVRGNHQGNGAAFRFLWAQNTSDTNSTTVYTGSVLRYRQVV